MSNARAARILTRVREIPEGFVRTYGDIDPGAPRLVGRVLAETDENLPWHRVVRADGSLAKGSRQRRLLLREGIPLRGDRALLVVPAGPAVRQGRLSTSDATRRMPASWLVPQVSTTPAGNRPS